IAQSDDEMPDRFEMMRDGDSNHTDDRPGYDASDDRLECEVGGYLIRARRPDAWGAIVSLLLPLHAHHRAAFHAVMRGCRDIAHSRPEIDGLDELLDEPEQHLHDLTAEREQRRSRQGYATPADARAFLEMARRSTSMARSGSAASPNGMNPIV